MRETIFNLFLFIEDGIIVGLRGRCHHAEESPGGRDEMIKIERVEGGLLRVIEWREGMRLDHGPLAAVSELLHGKKVTVVVWVRVPSGGGYPAQAEVPKELAAEVASLGVNPQAIQEMTLARVTEETEKEEALVKAAREAEESKEKNESERMWGDRMSRQQKLTDLDADLESGWGYD